MEKIAHGRSHGALRKHESQINRLRTTRINLGAFYVENTSTVQVHQRTAGKRVYQSVTCSIDTAPVKQARVEGPFFHIFEIVLFCRTRM